MELCLPVRIKRAEKSLDVQVNAAVFLPHVNVHSCFESIGNRPLLRMFDRLTFVNVSAR